MSSQGNLLLWSVGSIIGVMCSVLIASLQRCITQGSRCRPGLRPLDFDSDADSYLGCILHYVVDTVNTVSAALHVDTWSINK